jgi:oxalate decarboxylase/phosphoglucose isomerase-like protein (cupin superfamily)
MTRFDLETTYLSLDGEGHVTPLPVGPNFWKTIGENKAIRGALVTVGAGDGDWTHWEIHPQGDEVLVLLEGQTRIVFERSSGDEEVFDLRPGSTLVVPAGTWHRAEQQREVRMLFITYGSGTQHKPV